MTKQSNHNGSESGLRGWDFGQIITIVITDSIFSSYPIDDVPKGVSFLRVPMYVDSHAKASEFLVFQ